MIIWLASYPRSGNSLFRKILTESFGLDTFTQSDIISKKYDWEQFCQESTQSQKMFLVKTHFPPKDDQPFIYIVRDGRSVIQSYKKYYENFIPQRQTALLKLIMGDDIYGGWSSHFYSWLQRKNTKNLLLRFDELVNPTPEVLSKIGEFLNFKGEIKPFINRFSEYNKKDPKFYREGKVHFQPNEEWNDLIDAFFYKVHGKLMKELGYPIKEEGVILEPIMDNEVISYIQQLIVKNRELQCIADERQKLIRKNHEYVQNLLTELRERKINITTKWSN